MRLATFEEELAAATAEFSEGLRANGGQIAALDEAVSAMRSATRSPGCEGLRLRPFARGDGPQGADQRPPEPCRASRRRRNSSQATCGPQFRPAASAEDPPASRTKDQGACRAGGRPGRAGRARARVLGGDRGQRRRRAEARPAAAESNAQARLRATASHAIRIRATGFPALEEGLRPRARKELEPGPAGLGPTRSGAAQGGRGSRAAAAGWHRRTSADRARPSAGWTPRPRWSRIEPGDRGRAEARRPPRKPATPPASSSRRPARSEHSKRRSWPTAWHESETLPRRSPGPRGSWASRSSPATESKECRHGSAEAAHSPAGSASWPRTSPRWRTCSSGCGRRQPWSSASSHRPSSGPPGATRPEKSRTRCARMPSAIESGQADQAARDARGAAGRLDALAQDLESARRAAVQPQLERLLAAEKQAAELLERLRSMRAIVATGRSREGHDRPRRSRRQARAR